MFSGEKRIVYFVKETKKYGNGNFFKIYKVVGVTRLKSIIPNQKVIPL
jgi:hypothetical protein